jgi:hypothetical protein
MDEALQNVTDYIDTEGRDLSRRDWIRLLEAIQDYCQVGLDAAEDEVDEDDNDNDE